MALILNIDTATEKASICLAKDGKMLALAESASQKEHAAWLHPAIEQMMTETGYRLRDLQAVAVTAGPGSYTGLRVGMAAAKGFCFALDIPLIAEDTLSTMAFAAREQLSGVDLLCPMIDARRMEVFTAIYRNDLTTILPSTAMVVDENSFTPWLKDHQVSFFGDGSSKCKPIILSPHAGFVEANYHAGYLGIVAFLRYLRKEFTVLAYCEPAYTKEFYTHTRK
ncbi:tRNA (adenosine(37)-N6)-threonylcarbamoyltransferase complex dimerization subunit type 1 TsaB [Puia sp.]|jgi:tRNA threonylcarbamoyladenosine biosynthesis protein TsaB|uniref:tRNA (adenosine(37)-N6)-threonylcarbamoyltransferase complex dimerization subunit type 1 TsaB n=1 Tax=Puia sp. TaxID=2045100 RepID=UPI002F3FBA3D